MSLAGYTLQASAFNQDRGPQKFDPATGSSMQKPVLYNKDVATGSANRKFVTGSSSVTVIDPNGEGTCKPRLVGVASLSITIINSTSASPADPFTSAEADSSDITALGNFVTAQLAGGTIPAAA